MNWNQLASELALEVKERLGCTLCGAVPWNRPGVAIAFGNDGYDQDERTHREVTWLRHKLPQNGAEVLGFGLCDIGHTWVLIVKSNNVEWLNSVVWRAWGEANPLEPGAWLRSHAVNPYIEWEDNAERHVA
ncbi:MAG: hypothetical protein AB7O62_04510 [Pirellulales bacterium]